MLSGCKGSSAPTAPKFGLSPIAKECEFLQEFCMSKQYPKKNLRIAKFFDELTSAEPATDRDSALSLMKKVMNRSEDRYDLPHYERMNVFPFDCGWSDLDQDPCYWDDRAGNKHRVYLYNDGTIIIKRLPGLDEVLVEKAGGGAR